MADIFISYARTDRDTVARLAAALEAHGYSVWWDRQMQGGDNFSAEIERELSTAGAVIVAWSSTGSKSNWVKDEASVAADAGTLVAVSLDGSDPPIGFRQFHCLDLSKWRGGREDAAFGEVLRGVQARLAPADTTPGPAAPAAATEHARSRKAWLAGIVAIAVVAMVAVFALRGPGAEPDRNPMATSENAPINDKSIAVLPFTAMSNDEEDGFFADGLSEELLNALAQVDDLSVASRTSTFAFRNSDVGIGEIGRKLGVAHVLEGSVRRAGDRLRITAQLIKVEDGFHLWSETYDRGSADVIEIQEDIARRVSLALQSALVSDSGMPLMDVGTNNGAAYRLYLEGRALLDRRGLEVARAIGKFEEAVALDPDYAQAYGGLAAGHSLSSNYLRIPTAIAHQRARTNAQKAIALDGRLAEPYAVLAVLELEQNHWREAIRLFAQAEALDPEDPATLQWSGEALLYLGYIEAAKAKLLRALEIEPESAILNLIAGNIFQVEPDLERAEHYFRLAERNGMAPAVLNLGLVELQRGKTGAAAMDFARNMEALQFLASDDVDDMAHFLQAIVEGTLTVDGNIERFPALAADDDFRSVMYLYAGEGIKALEIIEQDVDRDKDTYFKVWADIIPGIRQLPEFKSFARNTGMLDYWREFGWPDKCRPVGEDDFACR